MPILKNEPAAVVRSMEELFAIAAAMELEASTRYSEIAERLRREGHSGLADLFGRLAADEQGHLDNIGRWSERAKGVVPDPALVRWRVPETFDDEGALTTDGSLLTAYRSLAMAVRNEERAFAFWSYVVAHARDSEIRRAAEAMAMEELGHVAALRRERRRSFHRERSAAARDGLGPLSAEELEARLADRLQALAAAADPSEAARLRRFEQDARRLAAEGARDPVPVRAGGPSEPPNDPVALSELLVDLYLEAADSQRDEAAQSRAQDFAGRAIERLAWLRRDLPEIDSAR